MLRHSESGWVVEEVAVITQVPVQVAGPIAHVKAQVEAGDGVAQVGEGYLHATESQRRGFPLGQGEYGLNQGGTGQVAGQVEQMDQLFEGEVLVGIGA